MLTGFYANLNRNKMDDLKKKGMFSERGVFSQNIE